MGYRGRHRAPRKPIPARHMLAAASVTVAVLTLAVALRSAWPVEEPLPVTTPAATFAYPSPRPLVVPKLPPTREVVPAEATATSPPAAEPSPPPPAPETPPPPAPKPSPPPPSPPSPCPTDLAGTRPHVAQVGRHIAAKFGVPLSRIGGWRAGSAVAGSDHPKGLALDFMVSRAKGDEIADYARANRGPLAVEYVIWRQRIDTGSGWRAMADRGGATANHLDHVHISFRANASVATC